MSASVGWRPCSKVKNSLHGQSVFMEMLKKVFNDSGGVVTLCYGDEDKLRAMALASREQSEQREDLEALADAVEQHECVEVWADY